MAVDKIRVKKLLKLYENIIRKFGATHIVACYCNKGTFKKPRLERVHIYFCNVKCKKQCNSFPNFNKKHVLEITNLIFSKIEITFDLFQKYAKV